MKIRSISYACIAFFLLLQACSSTMNSTATVNKRANILGTWQLANIGYEGINEVTVKSLFKEQNPKCFIGSTWYLPNNGSGYYLINEGQNCASIKQNIYWSASPAEDTFQFKKIEAGEKPKLVEDGFRLILSSVTKESMVLRSPVETSAGNAYIVLNFVKSEK
ncbi:hypothetical protein [Pedobacter flavus]|uniref:Lipocalin-like domain-containing protein n=1 Tax=Pedobacter flavus TaxID=3113906 RepID=A0ABU7H2V4_9SPHI|nr:hypothetical protein [Pedobacter sp. VNH31]MEE1885657.1 hypothetical protein [Pedobacter sp. VNH31]